MKLEKIFIRNFRSVGENGLELTFMPTRTTFIGENNVGKSSIFEAIRKVLEPKVSWDDEDWHAGNRSKTIEIRLECLLDENQIKQIIEILELPLTVAEFKENFTEKFIYNYEVEPIKNFKQFSSIFKIGELQMGKKGGREEVWIGEFDQLMSYQEFTWSRITEQIKSQKNKNLIQVIKDVLNKENSPRNKIIFNRSDILEDLNRLLRENIIVIEEFREKPQKALVEFHASPTGRELASVLFKLKNGRYEQKEKFEQIRQKFHKLFPILELDILREENNEIKILIQKAGIESTTFFLGAGILEALLLITHLIAHRDKVLCVDHPELHLHPHAQRRLDVFPMKNIVHYKTG